MNWGKVQGQVLLNPFALNVSNIHFHKPVRSPQCTVAGLKCHSNAKSPHQLHFSTLQNPSDPSDTSGSNKLDASTIGNSCANCIVLHSCAKASDLHAMTSAFQSGKVYKGGRSDKRETQINCCSDLWSGLLCCCWCWDSSNPSWRPHPVGGCSPACRKDTESSHPPLQWSNFYHNHKSTFIILFSIIFITANVMIRLSTDVFF